MEKCKKIIFSKFLSKGVFCPGTGFRLNEKFSDLGVSLGNGNWSN